MRTAPDWTEAQDAKLRRMRAEGASWAEIVRVLGRSRWAAMERARAIGAHRPPPDPAEPPSPAPPDRDPLPAGHPASWGPLVAGTLLDGTEYPLPFFFR